MDLKKRNGKELTYYHTMYYSCRILKIDEIYRLKVEINEPSRYVGNQEAFALRKRSEVEDYLFSLDNTLIVEIVCNKIMKLIGMTEEALLNNATIVVSYFKVIDGKERVISKISISKGLRQQFESLENREN